MGLVDIEFEFGKSKFDKKLIGIIKFIYSLYIITLTNWKKEGKKKKPKLLNFPLIKFSFIFSLLLLVVISCSLILLQFEKWELFGQLLLLLMLVFTGLALIFILIITLVSFFYLLIRFVKALSKTVRFMIDSYKEALNK
ncbi:MAG: hypothetical protein ABIG91_02820 [Patescibacteria group bacterium]